ncbi:MAG: hypothetical protein IJS26_06680 [Alphaproteobacteria bacterium]|nr:hypothetical protein [Alphaproteobacteria bacterium]
MFFALCVLFLSASSCEPRVTPPEPPGPEPERVEGQLITDAPQNPLAPSGEEDMYAIADLWLIDVCADDLKSATPVYLVKLENDKRLYVKRYNLSGELKFGDKIAFSYFNVLPDEIAKVKKIKTDDGQAAKKNAMEPASGSTLEISLPIITEVKDLFVLKMRHERLFSAKETVFIETTDGNMIYIEKSRLAEANAQDLKVGDSFMYNIYTIFPNKVYALRKF